MARSVMAVAALAVLLLAGSAFAQHDHAAEAPAPAAAYSHPTTPHDLFHMYNATEYAEIFEWVGLGDLINDPEAELTFFVAKDDAVGWFEEDHPEEAKALSGEDSEPLFKQIALFAVLNGTHTTPHLAGGTFETLQGGSLEVYRDTPSGFIHVFSPAGSVGHMVESNVAIGNSIVHFLDSPLLPVIEGVFNATTPGEEEKRRRL